MFYLVSKFGQNSTPTKQFHHSDLLLTLLRKIAHLGKGNGPLKSSHLKRQQAHTEKAKKEDILHTKLIVFR